MEELPNTIVDKILDNVDDIDTRLAFKLKPRKVIVPRLKRHEVVYDRHNRTMYDFTGMTDTDLPFWIIRRGIKFEYFRSPDMYVFNMGWDPYEMTLISADGALGPTPCYNHIVFRTRVKFV